MRRSYQKDESQPGENQVRDALEAYVREGARQMLAAILEEDVNAFLGRHRYGRSQVFRGYRNGYHPAREVTVGLQRYQRASLTTQRLFARLYLEGLATGRL